MKTFLPFLAGLVFLAACTKSKEDKPAEPQNTLNDAQLTVNKLTTSIGDILDFQMSYGTSGNVTVQNVNWDFGDGETYSGNAGSIWAKHAYAAPGTYTAKVTLFTSIGTFNYSKTVTINLTNVVRLRRVTLQSIPLRLYHWQNSTSISYEDWDFNGTYENDAKADLYFDVAVQQPYVRTGSIDQSEVSEKKIFTSPVIINRTSTVWNFATSNVYVNLSTLQNLRLYFYDSDVANSTVWENGTSDEAVGSVDLTPSALTPGSTSIVLTGSGSGGGNSNLQLTLEFDRL